MELLIETIIPGDGDLIVENANSPDKPVRLSGVFMQAEVKNRNNRIYPRAVLEQAVLTAQEAIKRGNGLLGELDHPESLTINLERVSHIIENIELKGNDAYGTLRIIDTPHGRIAKELIRNNVRIGVSSRAAGRVNDGIVDENAFKFITIDIVSQPSAPNAYPQALNESIEMATNGKQLVSLAEQLREDQRAQHYFKKELLKFLSEMNFAKNK